MQADILHKINGSREIDPWLALSKQARVSEMNPWLPFIKRLGRPNDFQLSVSSLDPDRHTS
jgi:hypothetical protein